MRIETYIPGLSKNTIEIVKHAESLGYDALVSGELNNEPFLPVLLGLEHSKKNDCKNWISYSFSKKPYDRC
tara:strand:+ start:570 stop:782 length:213 start_codon:yes stop_codon:yes gene_type:complete